MTRERVHLPVEIGFLRIETNWTIQTDPQGRRVAIPEVNQSYRSPERYLQDRQLRRLVAVPPTCTEIDGWELRKLFFRLEHTEEKTLQFLRDVGVWAAQTDPGASPQRDGKRFIGGYFSSRLFTGRALPVALDDLWGEQEHWKKILSSRAQLEDQFGSRPAAEEDEIWHWRFAWMTENRNEMLLHTEWRHPSPAVARAVPFSVIETITGYEMLIASIHLDVLRSGGKFRVCRRCTIPFPVLSNHKRMFCEWNCAHVVAERNRRKRKKREAGKKHVKKR